MFENIKKFIEETETIKNKIEQTSEQLTDEETDCFEYMHFHIAKALIHDLGKKDSSKIAKIILTLMEE